MRISTRCYTPGDLIILLDTSFLIAYFDSRDANHQKALKVLKEIENNEYGTPFISDYIFDETVTILKKYLGTKLASEKGDDILKAFERIAFTTLLFDETWVLFRKTQKLSFTDCSIVCLMKKYRIEYLTTFDSDFGSTVTIVDG